jgi:hypothetical protein
MRCGRYSVLSGRIWIILPILWEEILREFCYGLLIYIVKIIMLINNVCSKLHGVEKSLIGMSVYIVCWLFCQSGGGGRGVSNSFVIC